MATKRILVSSNCQTVGIAWVLRGLLNDVEVTATPLNGIADDPAAAREQIAPFDVWVSADRFDLAEGEAIGPELVKCPRLCFGAFHPDITFVRDESTGSVSIRNNSRLAAWAYSRDLTVEQASSLFRGEVFERLGYLGIWEKEVESLRGYYKAAYQFDFDWLYLGLKREGVFMHDLEHPTASALVRLGKAVARRIGATHAQLSMPINMPENWGHLSWPVYPEIADELGLQGSYTWNEMRNLSGGLPAYISYAFDRYRAEGITPGRVGILANGGFRNAGELYDEILEPMVL